MTLHFNPIPVFSPPRDCPFLGAPVAGEQGLFIRQTADGLAGGDGLASKHRAGFPVTVSWNGVINGSQALELGRPFHFSDSISNLSFKLVVHNHQGHPRYRLTSFTPFPVTIEVVQEGSILHVGNGSKEPVQKIKVVASHITPSGNPFLKKTTQDGTLFLTAGQYRIGADQQVSLDFTLPDTSVPKIPAPKKSPSAKKAVRAPKLTPTRNPLVEAIASALHEVWRGLASKPRYVPTQDMDWREAHPEYAGEVNIVALSYGQLPPDVQDQYYGRKTKVILETIQSLSAQNEIQDEELIFKIAQALYDDFQSTTNSRETPPPFSSLGATLRERYQAQARAALKVYLASL